MEEYPSQAEINGRLYDLNTDWKTAITCLDIIKDVKNEYTDVERALLVIGLLFKDWKNMPENDYGKAIEVVKKYLQCGKQNDKNSNEIDMDYIFDLEAIKSSFLADYRLDLNNNENMHWYDFYNKCNGLSEKCVLNRIRDIRTFDTSKLKDEKQKSKIEEMKEYFALPKALTPEEREYQRKYNEIFGINE